MDLIVLYLILFGSALLGSGARIVYERLLG